MIKHIFKIIWTEKKLNAWILLEMIVSFSILWFCTDYLFYMGKKYFEPKGFNIEDTYKINLEIANNPYSAMMTKYYETGEITDENRAVVEAYRQGKTPNQNYNDRAWLLLRMIEQYPGVEYASLSRIANPYNTGSILGQYFVDSLQSSPGPKEDFHTYKYQKAVSPDFFHVFQIKLIEGEYFNENLSLDRQFIISGDDNNLFSKENVADVKWLYWKDQQGNTISGKVAGVVNKTKRGDYEDFIPVVYVPLEKDADLTLGMEICFRLNPEADKNFINRFNKEMKPLLDVEPFSYHGIESLKDTREKYMKIFDYDSKFKSIYLVSFFLIFNILIGIVGTFWFRMQSRRGEVGLRMAMGASKKGIRRMYMLEAILLLSLATIISIIICINISMTDFLESASLPMVFRMDNEIVSWSRYLGNSALTFLALSIITIFSVWYPAQKASTVQPAEVLRDN